MIKDVTGQRRGRLTAILFTGRRTQPGGNAIWLCRCDCGKYVERPWVTTANSQTPSCGCYVKDRMSALNKTHGGRHERLYLVWMDMKRRCRDPKDIEYHNYGARGIEVCSEWQDYAKFREWALSSGYQDDVKHGACTLDRIDTNGNYNPSNCRWADMETQCNNRRSNVLIEYNGHVKTMSQWAKHFGVRYTLLQKRLKSGWDFEKAVLTPSKAARK